MVFFNSDVVFADTSGQVRSRNGDLTLRADDTGLRDIIVGSGVSLRPDIDCIDNVGIDLGRDFVRWGTLYACSGNFTERPTVNGSGVLLQGEAAAGGAGVDSLNGLAGALALTSPDESINISPNSPNIELSTPGSGAPSGASYILVDYNDNEHLTDARKLSATSGVILHDQGARSFSGIVIKLDFDNEPTANQILSWNGQKLQWVDDQTGAAGGGPSKVSLNFSPSSGTVFDMFHGLDSEDFVWSLWQTRNNEGMDLDPIQSMVPITVAPSGADHVTVNLSTATSGKLVLVG